MINLPHLNYNKPTHMMIAPKNRIKQSKRNKRKTAAELEQTRLSDKRNSPGVPPNTCPYIDLIKTILDDMEIAYDRLYTRGETQPKVEDMKSRADDLLEYVRRANECLRDNSAYWYDKYKDLLKKQ